MRLRASLNDLRDPTEPLAHGAMILLSGALLLTPGFFTDTIGFLLLVPRIRDEVIRQIGKPRQSHAVRPRARRAAAGAARTA